MLRELKSIAETDAVIDNPEPVWLLKHSSSCAISAYGMQEFMQYVNGHPDEAAAFVTVQHHRDISDHIADRLAVHHESPQLFLVQGGKPLFNASHGDISVENMEQARAGVL